MRLLSPPLALALLDAAAGLYLIFYAVRRERRDKPGVLVTGVVLLACAAALAWAARPVEEPGRLPPVAPAGELA